MFTSYYGRVGLSRPGLGTMSVTSNDAWHERRGG
jgi:hypothetical protein